MVGRVVVISMRGFQRSGERRRFQPNIHTLEDRKLLATGVSILSVVPNVLGHPRGQNVPVLVQGNITRSSTNETPTAYFRVVDQYRTFQPTAYIKSLKLINPNTYRYSVVIPLQASRSTLNGPNAIGRQYSILVVSQDADNAAAAYAGVLVPLDPKQPVRPINKLPGV